MAWSLLDGLDDAVRRTVVAACRRRAFARGEVLFHEGDPGDAVFVVTKGRVAIRVSTPLGDVATLAVMGPGDSFGEMALLRSDRTRTASAVALEASEALSLRHDEFVALRHRDPSVDALLICALTARVERLNTRLLEALYDPVDVRVARRLLALFDRFGDGGDSPTVALTQEDLASMAGTSRPTANRSLRDLERAGIVAIGRGRIQLLDDERLRRRAR
jgi:CRP/FNR family transcriptional regulator, cyclic AMP receptor protein